MSVATLIRGIHPWQRGLVSAARTSRQRAAYDSTRWAGTRKPTSTKKSPPDLPRARELTLATVPVRITRFNSKPASPVTSPTANSSATCISANAGIGAHNPHIAVGEKPERPEAMCSWPKRPKTST